jgi:hypothetical protein
LGGINVEPIASSAQKPSNVAVYLSVKEGDVARADLQAEHFRLYEDGLALDPKEVQLRLLDEHTSVAHHALVLLDLSGPIEESGALALLGGQLVPFLERLRVDHHVSVYGFDGTEKLTKLTQLRRHEPGRESATTRNDLAALTGFKQKDPSSNLHGAVTSALHRLDEEVRQSSKSLALGTLVIVARGPDLAGRTGQDVMLQAIDETPHQVLALTVGDPDDTSLARELGRDGHAQVKIFENLEEGLGDVARLVEADLSRYYLLAYCSPARAGERTLLVEVVTRDGDGGETTGSAEVAFDATGFQSGCDSARAPKFRDSKAEGDAAPSQEPNQGVDAPPEVEAATDPVPPPQDGETYAE